MAATLHPSRNDPTIPSPLYSGRALVTEIDLQNNRYPVPMPITSQRASTLPYSGKDRSGWDNSSNNDGSQRINYASSSPRDAGTSMWGTEQRTHQDNVQLLQPQSRASATSADIQSLVSQSQSLSQEPSRNTLSYALPAGTRRVVERYSLDDNSQRAPSGASANAIPISTNNGTRNTITMNPVSRTTPLPAGARRSISPSPGIGANGRSTNNDYPIMPLSASPSYNPPVAPKHRAYAQQPTYITPPTTPTPIQAGYSPRPPQQEEVCIECAMRDEDMADVDVTSPGIWDRESDAEYEELKRREEEDAANGLVTIDDPNRPRTRGGRLTEQNLKLWLSVNPREPTSRQQTLRAYIKSQKALLEAEALARARAMQEAKQLDNRMRDTYSQLRRSAYDLGNVATPADDMGGLRIKPPISPIAPIHDVHARSHSREVTLLENGMIVEHVDVRKEEREARERKRKEERRARKSSRGSTMDVGSSISANSMGAPYTDGGFGLRPNSPFSNSARPISVLTAPVDRRPDIPRAYSQASFSDVHSMASASPRRTRFFGFRNLSAGWRSQDSLPPSVIQSGSMIDMHLALDREAHDFGASLADLSARRSQIWPPAPEQPDRSETTVDGNPKKKKKGLAKIWGFVTGKQSNATRREASQSLDRNEDDSPLAPPPPLSYLVNRGPSELRVASSRHGSNPSLPSLLPSKLVGNGPVSPVLSPSTGPSSLFPSPASSSRISGPDVEVIEALNNAQDDKENTFRDESIGKNQVVKPKSVHPVNSEPDIRQRLSRTDSPAPPIPDIGKPAPPLKREKSLPPLPPEAMSRSPSSNAGDSRPLTVYTFDPRHLSLGSNSALDFIPPNAPFRNADVRRQSFGGVSSRPNLNTYTMPINGRKTGSPVASHYDDFGYSRRSLGPLDSFKDTIPVRQPAKRKSKFGLASLLGKKSSAPKDEYVDNTHHQFPLMRRSGSSGQEDAMVNGYATSASRQTALSSAAPPSRLSITSRKALEERVAQDSNFVAYRYPSNDQRLDLLR
ncbi:hypothetical protein C0995_010364 [Termitomyces sp. Mi166|nr:hypothetical protein C0995_010364 [Termitomyces sp. Mi166\